LSHTYPLHLEHIDTSRLRISKIFTILSSTDLLSLWNLWFLRKF